MECARKAHEVYATILEKKRASLASEMDPVTRMRITSDEVKAKEEDLKGKFMPFMIGYNDDGKLEKMTFIGNRMRKAACERHVQKKTTEISYRLHSWPLRDSFFEVNGDYLNLICIQGEFLDARALIQMEYLSMATDPTWTSDSDTTPPIKKISETRDIWHDLTEREMDN